MLNNYSDIDDSDNENSELLPFNLELFLDIP